MVVRAVAVALAAALSAGSVETSVERLDEVVTGRSFLAFLPSADGGHFSVRTTGQDDHEPPLARGVFWRTADGNAYTRLTSYDVALVRRAVAPLLRRIALRQAHWATYAALGRGVGLHPDVYMQLGATAYQGDEFQLTFEDFVVGAIDLVNPVVNELVDQPGSVCDAALAAHEDALRSRLAELRPAWRQLADGTQEWVVDLLGVRAKLAPLRLATQVACGGSERYLRQGDAFVTRLHRSANAVSFEVLDTSNWQTPYRWTPLLTVATTAGDPGPPPREPDPAPLFDVESAFLLKVSECGGLPWEYVLFAAIHDYEHPGSEDYVGPTPLGSLWECESEVSPDDRAEALAEE